MGNWFKKQYEKVENKVENVAKYATFEKNPLHKVEEAGQTIGHIGEKTYDVAHDVWMHGGREGLIAAGIVAGAVLTGGAVAGAVGAVEGGTLAGMAGAAGWAAGGAIAAGGLTGGMTAKAQHEAKKTAAEAERIQAEAQAEVDRANALEDAQRRASLYALRRQVGAVNVGKSSIFGSGSASASTKDETTGIVLG